MNSEKFKKVLDLYNGKPIEKEASIGDLDKSETFDIVQSKGDTNQIRKVAVSLTHEDEGFVLSANFEDDWTPLFKITADDNSIEEDYVTSVELLKKIQASIDGGNLDEAKKLFDGFVASAKMIVDKHADTTEDVMESEWTVTHSVDEDGHLNIYVQTDDANDVIRIIESGQGDGNKEQLAIRVTTDKIEKDYAKSNDEVK